MTCPHCGERIEKPRKGLTFTLNKDDKSLCFVKGCTNKIQNSAVLAPEELLGSATPFVAVGFCDKHLKVLDNLRKGGRP